MFFIVQKFGGSSLATPERIYSAVQYVVKAHSQGQYVAVVVSAMGNTTDDLVSQTLSISDDYDACEYDVIVAAGEQISSGLFTIALHQLGIQARSWLGWQIPIKTDKAHGNALVHSIDISQLKHHMSLGEVPVITGFQGVSEHGRITTLGRGASDLTAVLLAAALNAQRCEIYTDVDGVYTADPNIVMQASKIAKISYEEMLELSSLGARVLQARSVRAAKAYGIPLLVRSSFEEGLGTLVTGEEAILEKATVSGVSAHRNEAKITVRDVPDKPGVAALIFRFLSDADIDIDMIVQSAQDDFKRTDITFTLERHNLAQALSLIQSKSHEIDYRDLTHDAKVAKISIVGLGMRDRAGAASLMFRILAEKGINIQVISTSEIKVSVLIDEDYTELALRALHTGYGLDSDTAPP